MLQLSQCFHWAAAWWAQSSLLSGSVVTREVGTLRWRGRPRVSPTPCTSWPTSWARWGSYFLVQLILLYSRDIIGRFSSYFGKWHYTIEVITTFSVNVATIRAVNQIDRVYFEPAAFFSRYFSRMNPKLACSVWSQLAVYITSNCVTHRACWWIWARRPWYQETTRNWTMPSGWRYHSISTTEAK